MHSRHQTSDQTRDAAGHVSALRAVPAPGPEPKADDLGLVERSSELETIAEAVASVLHGAGSLVAIEGPAGIGKTVLLEHAARRAGSAGWLVRRAAPVRVEGHLRFGLIRTLLEAPLRRAATHDRGELCAGTRRLAAKLLLGDVPPGAVDVVTLAQSVASLCSRLAERTPLALIVDDVHWADQASTDVLAYLARHVEDLPMLLVLATRGHGLGSTGAGSFVGPDPLRPAPLTWLGAMRLVRRLAPGTPLPACADCCAAARGNPWLLERLATTLPGPGLDAAAFERARIPRTVRDAVRLRLRELTPPERELALAQSILGEQAPPQALAELAGATIGQLVALRAGLATTGLFDLGGKRYVHSLIAAAVEDNLEPVERDRLHREGAFAMAAAGGDLGEAGAHLLRSEPRGEFRAAELLSRAAADARERGRPGAAAELLERALSEDAPSSDRPRLLIELARARFHAGTPGTGEALREALAAATDPATRHDALAALEAHALLYGGRVGAQSHSASVTMADRARAALSRRGGSAAETVALAIEALADGSLLDDVAEDPAFHRCVCVLLIAERFSEARPAIDRLREMALRRGSVPMQVAAAWYGGELELHAGTLHEAERLARHALELAGNHNSAFSAGATRVLVHALAERGSFAEARALLRARGFGDQVGHAPGATGVLEARAFLRLAEGDFARALADARELSAREMTDGAPDPRGWGSWSTIEALALAHQGRTSEAAEVAAAALGRAQHFGAPGAVARAWLACAVAEADNRGRAATCERALAEVPGAPRVVLARLRLELGVALSRLGRRIEARSALRPALADAAAAGASLLAERARRELVVTGLRPRRPALDGVGALTPRQQEICELAAAGKGNRAIAAQLFLSIKTVETHLAAAYCKLGVAGRAELAGALAS